MKAHKLIDQLKEAGIDMDTICELLQSFDEKDHENYEVRTIVKDALTIRKNEKYRHGLYVASNAFLGMFYERQVH